jgi:hypothetical protein
MARTFSRVSVISRAGTHLMGKVSVTVCSECIAEYDLLPRTYLLFRLFDLAKGGKLFQGI